MTSDQNHGSKDTADTRDPNSSPLVSICIPSFNCQDYIEQTLQSIQEQDYTNLEIIISDDRSTDNTVNVINRFIDKSKLTNIQFHIAPKKLGLQNNWNHAMSFAKGKYVKILPSDDYLYQNCISKQVDVFEANDKRLSVVFCARDIIDKNSQYIVKTGPKSRGLVEARELLKQCVIRGTNVIGEPGAVLFKRSDMQAIGEFDGSLPYVIDLDYWRRLLDRGDGYTIGDSLCTFRIDNNLSVRLGFRRPANFCKMIDRIATTRNFNNGIILVGKARTYLNELLRRCFYTYIRLKTRK